MDDVAFIVVFVDRRQLKLKCFVVDSNGQRTRASVRVVIRSDLLYVDKNDKNGM